jgi:hypothetical protein
MILSWITHWQHKWFAAVGTNERSPERRRMSGDGVRVSAIPALHVDFFSRRLRLEANMFTDVWFGRGRMATKQSFQKAHSFPYVIFVLVQREMDFSSSRLSI